jgi:UDPglucose 6-dehydrogenase
LSLLPPLPDMGVRPLPLALPPDDSPRQIIVTLSNADVVDRIIELATADPEVAEVMKELYGPFVRTGKPILIMDPASAELTKYAANAMLASRISFMNEMARLAEKTGADISHIRRAVGSDSRIGGAFLFPGVGYGVSCFPKDVRALIQTALELKVDLPLVQATEKVNEAQKLVLVPKIREFYGGTLDGITLALWGLAFKPRTDDMREAPSISLISKIVDDGARVRVFDPEAMQEARKALAPWKENITYCQKSYEACQGADGLVLVTEWNEFRNPDFQRIRSLLRRPVIFDGRNIYNRERLKEFGFSYFGVGRC